MKTIHDIESENKKAIEFLVIAHTRNALASAAKAIEREAIDEVIREQFSKEIAERVAQKQAKLTKRQNAK